MRFHNANRIFITVGRIRTFEPSLSIVKIPVELPTMYIIAPISTKMLYLKLTYYTRKRYLP